MKRIIVGLILIGWKLAPAAYSQTPEWYAAVAEISVSGADNSVPGTGFVVAIENKTAYIITCAHVASEGKNLLVTFVADPAVPHPAVKVDLDGDDRVHGLAFLAVESPPPTVRLLPISSGKRPVQGDGVSIAGFPTTYGSFLAPATTIAGFIGSDIVLSQDAEMGYSGGPVVVGAQAIGMIFGHKDGHGEAIPSEVLSSYVDGQIRKLRPPPLPHVGTIILEGCPEGSR